MNERAIDLLRFYAIQAYRRMTGSVDDPLEEMPIIAAKTVNGKSIHYEVIKPFDVKVYDPGFHAAGTTYDWTQYWYADSTGRKAFVICRYEKKQ